MYYYKLNLGDYTKKAGRLSMLQHGSYTLLIDGCYDREQFPTLEEAIEWTWASTTEEIEAASFVLRKFFDLEDGAYVQKRIQEEIAVYQGKDVTNKRIAEEREQKRRDASTSRDEKSTTYASEAAVSQFQTEGQASREWRSLVWEHCHAAASGTAIEPGLCHLEA
jgi:uncharacterized protein YdaU (DUF1376 family)